MIVLRKELFGFVAVDDAGEKFTASVKLGECVTVTAKRPRNIGHHRKFFGLLDLVFKNQEMYSSLEHLLDAVKIGIGHVTVIQVGKQMYQIPLSINFFHMDQVAFGGFYNSAVDWLLAEVIPGTDRAALEQEVLEMAR